MYNSCGSLGYVNMITAAPIAEQEAKAKQESMTAVLPDASDFGEEIIVKEGNITSVTPALNEDGEEIGYAVAITTKASLQVLN